MNRYRYIYKNKWNKTKVKSMLLIYFKNASSNLFYCKCGRNQERKTPIKFYGKENIKGSSSNYIKKIFF